MGAGRSASDTRGAARGCALASAFGALGVLGALLTVGVVIAIVVTAIFSLDFNFDIGRHPGKGRQSRHLAVAVTPASGLLPEQAVRVTSRSFGAEQLVGVAVCLSEADTKRGGVDACDTVHGSRYVTDALARLDASFRVPRVITIGSRAYDCATRPGRCLVVAANADHYNDSGGRPIGFRAGLPTADLVAEPTRRASNILPFHVQPAGALLPGQPFVVDAVGFQPGEPLVTAWCTRSVLTPRKSMFELLSICDASTETMTAVMSDAFANTSYHADPLGHLRLAPKARSSVMSVTCASKPGACVYVIAAAADLQRSAVVPITIHS